MKPAQLACFAIVAILAVRTLSTIMVFTVEHYSLADDSVHKKYPDRTDRRTIMMDFNHTDNIMLIKESWQVKIDLASWAVLGDVALTAQLVLMLPVLLTVKQQFKRSADEKELFMMVCFCLGVGIPILVAAMSAGPRSMGAWMAKNLMDIDEGKPMDHPHWANFGPEAWHSLQMSYMLVESIGVWVWDIDMLLMGTGFLLMASLGKERAPNLITKPVYIVGTIIGCLEILAFLLMLLRMASWMAFSMLGFVVLMVNFLIMYPAFFILLGKNFGQMESLEEMDLNSGLLSGGGDAGNGDIQLEEKAGDADDADSVRSTTELASSQ